MSKVVLALSGGLDSSVLLYHACTKFERVYCLFFDYNQRHKKEYSCALKQIELANKQFGHKCDLTTINVPLDTIAPVSSLTNLAIDTPNVKTMRGEAQPKSYVPFRNLLFITYLLSFAESVGADKVWYGAALVDSLSGYWDGSKEFLDRINLITDLNREHRITVEAPLITLSKSQIIQLGIDNKVRFDHTWTCYEGGDVADAETASSSTRLKGFIDLKLRDPLQYKQQEMLDKIYDQQHCKHIKYK